MAIFWKRPPAPLSRRAKRRRRLLTATGLSAALAAAGSGVISQCTLCYVVPTQPGQVAYVQGQETYHQAVRQVEERVSEILQTNYSYPAPQTLAPALVPKEEVIPADTLTDTLLDTVEQVQPACTLLRNGEFLAAAPDRDTIVEALSLLQDFYTTPCTLSVAWEETLSMEEGYLPADHPLLTAPELVDFFLTAGEEGPLTVITQEEETYFLPVEPTVEEIPDPNLLVGESWVVEEGTPGQEQRTDLVTRRQGKEVARTPLLAQTLQEPSPTRLAVGTAQGAEGAVGRFQWPCQGEISSPFGDRTLFGSAGFHRGIDIPLPQGTPIVAAANGIVSWAEEKGTYGNLVVIDHLNGYETYYAHNARILVEEGAWVTQGQLIALAGSTGRSTGPHCHFELRWGGEPFDPLLCLP